MREGTKFVTVGYGRVGSRTVRVLQEEGHEVVVVEVDHERVDRARKAGIAVIEGDGGDEAVLERAGLAEADAVAGLTGDLNTNFAACSVGKHHGCRTVMRTDEDYREDVYRQYADDVDELVCPERPGAAGAKTALLGGEFNVIADLAERLQMTVLTIEERSPAVGRRVVAVDLPQSGRRADARAAAEHDGRGRRPRRGARRDGRAGRGAAGRGLSGKRERASVGGERRFGHAFSKDGRSPSACPDDRPPTWLIKVTQASDDRATKGCRRAERGGTDARRAVPSEARDRRRETAAAVEPGDRADRSERLPT